MQRIDKVNPEEIGNDGSNKMHFLIGWKIKYTLVLNIQH